MLEDNLLGSDNKTIEEGKKENLGYRDTYHRYDREGYHHETMQEDSFKARQQLARDQYKRK